MWKKKLWIGREQVYFELPNTVPRLTKMDEMKFMLEGKLGKLILWWPLTQPRRRY